MREALASKHQAEIRGMFGRIAPRYDLLNRVLSLGQDVSWRRQIARRLAAASPDRVLDVCTGTGDVALALPAGPLTVGSDFCLPMLARARSKAARRRRRLPLVAADALGLPLADGSVDAVTVAFGMRNFSDLEAGLAELVRVLAPGGTLLLLEFSRPSGVLAPLLSWWVRQVPPRVGRWISGDAEAYSYLPDSVGRFAAAHEVCGILERLGLEGVWGDKLTAGVATIYQGQKPAGAAVEQEVEAEE
jgi:demethylmenaquinone methyltransferase/2-methoxy-6-polyprenyl-1,4-benzoquinol methylase